MKVCVRFFASCREAAGTEVLELDLPQDCDIGAVVEEVMRKYPGAKEVMKSTALARNLEYVPKGEPVRLKEGDEVAFIPPVSGG
eukprot:scaffold682_cov363-Pavlova_lutheri.AAC.47